MKELKKASETSSPTKESRFDQPMSPTKQPKPALWDSSATSGVK